MADNDSAECHHSSEQLRIEHVDAQPYRYECFEHIHKQHSYTCLQPYYSDNISSSCIAAAFAADIHMGNPARYDIYCVQPLSG